MFGVAVHGMPHRPKQSEELRRKLLHCYHYVVKYSRQDRIMSEDICTQLSIQKAEADMAKEMKPEQLAVFTPILSHIEYGEVLRDSRGRGSVELTVQGVKQWEN